MSTHDFSRLESAVFDCAVTHERLLPRRHRFRYGLFYVAVYLDELTRLQRELRMLRVNRPGLLSLWENDFLPVNEAVHNPGRDTPPAGVASPSLQERVIGWCAARGFDPGPGARVMLVTIPRMFGHAFNPVTFYFCFDASGRACASIAEVTNTFREMKPYLVPPQRRADGGTVFRLRAPKEFYVSPFSPCDGVFDFTLRAPGPQLAIQIDHYEGTRRTLHSTLTGRRRPLTDATLAVLMAKYPLISARVIGLIHWEALRLWARRMPFFRKADAIEHQRDLHRPHASLKPEIS